MIRRPPRSTLSSSSAASDVYKRQRPLCGDHHRLLRPDGRLRALVRTHHRHRRGRRPALRRHRGRHLARDNRSTRPHIRRQDARGGPLMKNYDNLVGLILSVLVTAYLIYALIAPEKL